MTEPKTEGSKGSGLFESMARLVSPNQWGGRKRCQEPKNGFGFGPPVVPDLPPGNKRQDGVARTPRPCDVG